jgi:hypothetical protein
MLMELIEGNTKIELEYIGEGFDGDYDPTDPDDLELLRYTVLQRESEDDEWEPVDDGSYCTMLPETLTDDEKMTALRILMSQLSNFDKRTAERMSWISPDTLKGAEVA